MGSMFLWSLATNVFTIFNVVSLRFREKETAILFKRLLYKNETALKSYITDFKQTHQVSLKILGPGAKFQNLLTLLLNARRIK